MIRLLQIENEAKCIRSQLFDFAATRHPDLHAHSSPCLYPECLRLGHTYSCFCDVHALHVYRCRVAPSLIANAGFGLFANEDIAKDDVIDLYCGSSYDVDSKIATDYGFNVLNRYMVHAEATQSCITRYINHLPDKANVMFKPLMPHETNSLQHIHVAVLASRDIEKGEELYVDYGKTYDFSKAGPHVVEKATNDEIPSAGCASG